jgi:serine/threonine protein kinase/tetratricopeptide (TPR) repeat protein
VSFVKLALPPRFEIVRRIGEGGMGVVYEAIDVERGERIALKTILHHDADTIARVKHEFRSLQDIHHPNLVTLRELVADVDDVFFTMDLVDGVDLMTWIRGPRRRSSVSTSPTAVDLRSPALATDTIVDIHGSTRDDEAPVSDVRDHAALEPAAFDEGRMRDVFRQVAVGLSALHAAGKVHRDVKPSNVRVTAEGRVVLLDFGLVFEVDARQLSDGNVVGTPAYMAPEQASMGPVAPEADWYAVGVMLYEGLTGRRPFEGAANAVLLAKNYQEALPPRAFVSGVPRDLEDLCLELLRVEPRARPSGREVLRRLQARSSDRPATGGVPFVGRDLEIQALERAFGDVLGGGSVTVALVGESGVGKSCLVRRFFDVVLAGRDDVLVLTGRCYERESVPYKALDEVIENLSRRLGRMSRDEVAALAPPDADSLSLLFPAMGRVPALEQRASSPERDPLERRRVAFRALRELLRRLSARRRVVITIDDLQWTDADSLALLQDILRPPNAPAILLVVTMREATGEAGAAPSLLASLPGEVRTIKVDRLARDDARRLAEVLLAQAAGTSWSDAAAIAAEADGHPLFIDELVRHASLSRESTTGSLRLDDALWRRVLRLDEASRRVLDVACLLGAPVSQEVVAHAAGIDMGELAHAVSLLRATHLVRTQGARVTDAIEPFHDRVREALVARLAPNARQASHARIAAALELAKGSNPEVLATHWAGANEPAKAARYALVAAEQAGHALAFERAARLFELALTLLPEADPRRRVVREQLGDALANAGDCAGAATAYEVASRTAGPIESLELRRRAADQLMRAGEMVRGLDAARGVLAAVGLPLPRTMVGALLALLWFRLVIRLRGLKFVPREARDIAPAELTRIDVCWSVSFSLPYADPLAAGVSHARHVLLALRAGDPVRAARALAMEASYLASSGFDAWPRAERTLGAADAAAVCSGDEYARTMVLGLRGVACCAAVRFEEAIGILKEAVVRFRAHVPGSAFEITTAYFFLFVAMAYSGRYGELRPRLEAALVDAKERGDRYAQIMLRLGILNSTWIFAGEPARARREIAEARRGFPNDRFRAVHYQALVAECYIDVYEGEYERAYALLHATLPAVRRSLILQLQAYRAELAALRGRIAIACAASATGRRRAKLLREAMRLLPDIAATPGALGRVNARVIRANAALIRGRTEEALVIAEAMAGDEAGDAWLSRNSARYFLGRLRGDTALVLAAEQELASRGGVAHVGLIRLYFPAFEPEAPTDRSSPSPASSPGSGAPSSPSGP